MWNENASTVAVDFGTVYIAPVFKGLRIGASMSNFGSKMRLEGRDALIQYRAGAGGQNLVDASLQLEGYDLPLLFRVGLATEAIRDENSRLTVAVDAIHPNDNTEYINSGIEYTWGNILSLRAGWNSAFEQGSEKGLTLGGGVEYEVQNSIVLLFDYGYQDFGRLGEAHFLSVGVKF